MEAPLQTRLPWWPLPILVAIAFLIFWPTLAFTAFSDDHSALWNSGVRGIPWRNGFFRPLSDLTFHIGYLVHGVEVSGHRAFNVALHGLNAFLVFALFVRLAPTGEERELNASGFAASLLFLLYPFHQESIVWLVGRESSLGTLFVLAGLLTLKAPLSRNIRLIALVVCSVLGALCYESALLLVPLAFVITWPDPKSSALSLRETMIAAVCGMAIYFSLRIAAVGWSGDSYITGLFIQDISSLLYHAPKAMARLFLPPDLDSIAQVRKGAFLLAGLLIVLVAFALKSRRSKHEQGVAFVWLGSLLISCAIPVLAGVSTVTSESDRLLYMPSVFLCSLFGYAFQQIPSAVLRRTVWLVLAMISFHFLRLNHAGWEQASVTTQRIMEQLPEVPAQGRLFVTDLPDNYQGAFVFRNGFPEAVHLANKDGGRVVDVHSRDLVNGVITAQDLHFRGSVLHPDTSDRWYRWNGAGFHALDTPVGTRSTQ